MKYLIRLTVITLIAVSTTACKQNKQESATEEPADIEEVIEVDIKGEKVTYATDSTTMKGYIAYNENLKGKRPGIVVIHEWWGSQ
jgi:hypothetical protein